MCKQIAMQCPLCSSDNYTAVTSNTKRSFYKCNNCWLIFINPADYPSADKEKARYNLHENTEENTGYVNFLNKAIIPTLPYLNTDMKGLDYGCGPQPTLSKLLADMEINCQDYDPFFKPIKLSSPYDFIFSTEAFEHFHHPSVELENITQLLKPGGVLTIMTDHWTSLDQFANWYYINDNTHVCFYNVKTFNYIKTTYGYNLLFTDNKRVVILKKEN